MLNRDLNNFPKKEKILTCLIWAPFNECSHSAGVSSVPQDGGLMDCNPQPDLNSFEWSIVATIFAHLGGVDITKLISK